MNNDDDENSSDSRGLVMKMKSNNAGCCFEIKLEQFALTMLICARKKSKYVSPSFMKLFVCKYE